MLRPSGKPWFALRPSYRDETYEEKRWLEYATNVQRRAMYDRVSQFTRATKEADHDFAAFGQCVLTVELNRNRDALLYRCWHLRDIAWRENADGQICQVHRNWNVTAYDLKRQFGEGKLADQVKKLLSTDPLKEIKCRHIVLKSEEYESAPGGKKWNTPYVSVYLDIENEHEIESVGLWSKHYVIPRWQTVSGSQYAYSPSTLAACPDARLIQAMTLTLLQAGERAADPPKIAREGVIRSDVDFRSGGVTWIDGEYDEKLGEAIRTLENDKSGIPFGLKMREDAKETIREAFFLDKISLPPIEEGREMTAFEASQRVQDYIRQALPLFEPMSDNYNGEVCEETFPLLMRNGAFGPVDNIPQSLRGQEMQFKFESPLQRAEGADKGMLLQNAVALATTVAAIDQDALAIIDGKAALREALYGSGMSAKAMRSEAEVEAIVQANNQQRQAAQMAQSVGAAGQTAEQVGNAIGAVKGALEKTAA